MKSNEYYVDFGTGVGNFWIRGTLDKAIAAANKDITYTQCDVKIEDEDGNEVARRKWWPTQFDAEEWGDDLDIIDYGEAGYYDEWLVR